MPPDGSRRRCMRLEASAGPIELYFPHTLTADDLSDFEECLAIWLRARRREAAAAKPQQQRETSTTAPRDDARVEEALKKLDKHGPLPPMRLVESFGPKLLEDLPALFAEYPEGITGQIVRERYNANYGDALEAMRWLDAIGAGKWVHERGRPGNSKILVPPDADIEEHELSERQERVMLVLRSDADENGMVSVPMRIVSARANVSAGSMPQILDALEQKGLIMLAKPAARNGTSAAVYQILTPETEMAVEPDSPTAH